MPSDGPIATQTRLRLASWENTVVVADILDGERFIHHLHINDMRIVNCGID